MFLELRASTAIFRLGSGSGGFGPTDCRQRLHFPWADCDAEVLATPYRESSFDREKARSLSKKRLAGPGMFTCLPYATWRGIWNYASMLCVKQSSTISTPMFTFTIFIHYKNHHVNNLHPLHFSEKSLVSLTFTRTKSQRQFHPLKTELSDNPTGTCSSAN